MLGGIFGRKAGGSALKGEDKVSCAMRELLEETGISSNDLQEISCYTSHDIIYYCFLCVTDCDKTSITLPASITACDFYKKQGYTYKNGIDVIDEQQLFHLEKFRFVKESSYEHNQE